MKITDEIIIKALKSGKVVRRSGWEAGYYIQYDSLTDFIEWHEIEPGGYHKHDVLCLRISTLEADDWIINK